MTLEDLENYSAAWIDLMLVVQRSWWSSVKWHFGGRRKVMNKFRKVCKTEGSTVEDAVIAILPGPVAL